MIPPKKFLEFLLKKNVSFFAGVPDSLLREFCLCVSENIDKKNHHITVNEGAAIALGAGYHLATKKLPLIYLQNSGFGNIINPLLSLCDPYVYGIPLFLMIGWRGDPQTIDEPQHKRQGLIQKKLLEILEIPFEVIDKNFSEFDKIDNLVDYSLKKSRISAILIKKNSFAKHKNTNLSFNQNNKFLLREDVIKKIISSNLINSIFLTTTGKTSREFNEIYSKLPNCPNKHFLNVGAMGFVSMLSLGLSMFNSNQVVCIDGDGSVLMHMGNLASLGLSNQKNLIHIILNNGSHESVGGQPTFGDEVNFTEIAKSCGYKHAKKVYTDIELENSLNQLNDIEGPFLLEIDIKNGSRENLERPKSIPLKRKKIFINNISD